MNEEENSIKTPPWVLIIENDILVNRGYRAKFSRENIEIKIAEDGELGLETLKEGELPSLILLELILPKKDGFKVLEEIKQDPRLKDIPVLIVTNLAQEMDIKRGIELGAKEYLVKDNLKLEELIKKVKQYLNSGI